MSRALPGKTLALPKDQLNLDWRKSGSEKLLVSSIERSISADVGMLKWGFRWWPPHGYYRIFVIESTKLLIWNLAYSAIFLDKVFKLF